MMNNDKISYTIYSTCTVYLPYAWSYLLSKRTFGDLSFNFFGF